MTYMLYALLKTHLRNEPIQPSIYHKRILYGATVRKHRGRLDQAVRSLQILPRSLHIRTFNCNRKQIPPNHCHVAPHLI